MNRRRNRRVRTGPVRWSLLSSWFQEGTYVVAGAWLFENGHLIGRLGSTAAEAMPRVES